MKKIILMMILFAPFIVSAQVEKGNVFIGGTIGVASVSQSPGGSGSQVVFSPRVGFLINDHHAFGGGFNIETSKSGDTKSNSFGVAGFHRYYAPITESFFFVLHSELAVDFGKTTLYEGAPDIKSTQVTISTGPRFAYFASKHWSFEGAVGSLSFSSTTSKPDGGTNTTTSTFGLSAGTVSLGVFYYIK